jgi:hypothetical protein
MARLGAGHLLGIKALIKAHQPTAMGHGQSQKAWLGWPQASARRAAIYWAGC